MSWFERWTLGMLIAGIIFILGVVTLVFLDIILDSRVDWKGLLITLFSLALAGFLIGTFIK